MRKAEFGLNLSGVCQESQRVKEVLPSEPQKALLGKEGRKSGWARMHRKTVISV